jgi:hypothetical protein
LTLLVEVSRLKSCRLVSTVPLPILSPTRHLCCCVTFANLTPQGWPQTYFYDPLVKVDRDDGILWFGVDTVNASNSRPGRWEREDVGVQGTYARDRHTRIEPAALEVLFRWAGHVLIRGLCCFICQDTNG